MMRRHANKDHLPEGHGLRVVARHYTVTCVRFRMGRAPLGEMMEAWVDAHRAWSEYCVATGRA
jgi:hypothetical protein